MLIDGNLAEAIEKVLITRIARPDLEPGNYNGYVIDATDRLVLFLNIDTGLRFNGFSVFRVEDCKGIEVPAPYAEFQEKALQLRGEEVKSAPEIELDSFESVLRSSTSEFSLVTVHREEVDSAICHIGKIVSVSAHEIELLEISPAALWDNETTSYNLSEVTRVDFGGSYEEALWLVGNSLA